MRKFILGLAFLGITALTSLPIHAQQEEEEPCPEGSTNSFGGVCCISETDCRHPTYGLTAESTWTPCIMVCD